MSLYDKKRQQFKRNIRKQHIQKHFQKIRKQFHKPFSKEEFMAVYPNVDEDNYSHHKQLLKNYSSDPEYAFLLTALSGQVYDFLMENNNDLDSILILQAISSFQEVDIPQTEEFVDWLIYLGKKSQLDTLIIVSNLLSHGKYKSLLRDILLQKEFLSIFPIHQFVEQKRQIQLTLLAEILCSCLSSHPLIEINLFRHICFSVLEIAVNENIKWLIANTFVHIRITFPSSNTKQNELYAEALLQIFEKFINHQFVYLQFQCLNLLFYCSKMQVFSKNLYIHNLIVSSLQNKSHEREIIIEEALLVIEKYIQNGHFIQNQNIVNDFVNIFIIEQSINIKQHSLMLLNTYFQKEVLKTLFSNSKEFQQVFEGQLVMSMIQSLLHCLQYGSSKLIVQSLKQVIILLDSNEEKIVHLFESLGLRKQVQIIEQKKIKQAEELILIIFSLLSA